MLLENETLIEFELFTSFTITRSCLFIASGVLHIATVCCIIDFVVSFSVRYCTITGDLILETTNAKLAIRGHRLKHGTVIQRGACVFNEEVLIECSCICISSRVNCAKPFLRFGIRILLVLSIGGRAKSGSSIRTEIMETA